MKLLKNKYKETLKFLFLIKKALEQESIENKDMLLTYIKLTKKQATKEELQKANRQFRELLKTVGVSSFLFLPFSFITLPIVFKIAKFFNINLIPNSFIKEVEKNKQI